MAEDVLQILKLSPIPELSEIELGNVLEQFGELSELTGELTDRNVEDILREAEELLDISSSVKEMSEEIASDLSNKTSQNESDSNKKMESKTKVICHSEKKKDRIDEIPNPPKQLSTEIIKSPGSKNPIKSTIDSLKEYSNRIENQMNCKVDQNVVSKSSNTENKLIPGNDESEMHWNEKIKKTDKTTGGKLSSSNIQGSPKSYFKKNPTKLKTSEKLQKSCDVRKTDKNFKCKLTGLPLKDRNQNMMIPGKKESSLTLFQPKILNSKIQKTSGITVVKENELDLQKCLALLDEEAATHQDSQDKIDLMYPHLAEKMLKQSKESISLLHKEISDLKAHLISDKLNDKSEWNSILAQKFMSQEGLIQNLKKENTKLFQEIKEIKGQMKIHLPDFETEKIVKEKEEIIRSLRSEVESLRNNMNWKLNDGSELSRLEEQFALVKDKYNQQIGKLELENKELKEALHCNKSSNEISEIIHKRFPSPRNIGIQTEKSPITKPTKLVRSISFESWHTEKSKTLDNVRRVESSREAFCQTERQRNNVGIQKNVIKDTNIQSEKKTRVLEILKTENKENVALDTKKNGKQSTNFIHSDQILTLTKPRKAISEHENHLMATLRGLHAEVLAKDKENKILKKEVESLRNQIKKYTGNPMRKKVESKKKVHAGIQTIGLGLCVPIAYDPSMFQVSKELENGNEKLQIKIKALEENCIQLKEKRTNDLQILQEIHEEEMAKLVSKLDTQTALAKHLHTLLLNR